MNNNAKNISIFLPNGNPKGIKKASITRDKIEVIHCSRIDFLDNKYIFDFIGIYIIVDTLETDTPKIYIGKGKISERINQHHNTKDFWNNLFAVNLKTDEGFNDTHISYMEHYFINKAKNAERSNIEENKQIPNQPRLEESILCDIKHYIEVTETLITILGLKVFQDFPPILSKQEKEANMTDVFYIKSKNIEATGQYTEEGFILHEGSQIKKDVTKTVSNHIKKLKQLLLEKHILKEKGEDYVLTKNYKCNSPSLASGLVLGRSDNGWTSWKNKQQKTLNDVYRDNKE